jgi:hypothetical protein
MRLYQRTVLWFLVILAAGGVSAQIEHRDEAN